MEGGFFRGRPKGKTMKAEGSASTDLDRAPPAVGGWGPGPDPAPRLVDVKTTFGGIRRLPKRRLENTGLKVNQGRI